MRDSNFTSNVACNPINAIGRINSHHCHKPEDFDQLWRRKPAFTRYMRCPDMFAVMEGRADRRI